MEKIIVLSKIIQEKVDQSALWLQETTMHNLVNITKHNIINYSVKITILFNFSVEEDHFNNNVCLYVTFLIILYKFKTPQGKYLILHIQSYLF